MRLAFIVSHPIQYYVPIYRGLAERIRQADERLRDERPRDEELERPKDSRAERDRPERSDSRAAGSPAGEINIRVEKTKRPKDEETRRRETEGGLLTTDDSARISALKVFYTWRDAGPARDVKFGKDFAWDIPLMEGYDFEVVPNTSAEPGTHHRKGLINPDLVERVQAWKPDAVVITGYNYVSHGQAIKELSKAGIPVIFRGDSHLLDDRGPWWKWWIKKCWLSRVYRWPEGFAYVGRANRDYYRAFGVPERKLFHVPHTIEVGRFAEPHEELEAKALAWRRELGIPDDHFVFLYAAKLEPRKRPMELLEAFLAADIPKTTLVFVGSGELESALKERAFKGVSSVSVQQCFGKASDTEKPKNRKTEPPGAELLAHRVVFVPFQNQSQMPVVYRLGDALVLPSGYGETWGLAVNEAQACGRPSLVSDCVGCARDIIREGENGFNFRTDDWGDCVAKMKRMAVAWSKESNKTERPKDEETKSLKDGEPEVGDLNRSEAEIAEGKPEAGTEGNAADGSKAKGSPRRPTNERRKDEEPNVESKREAIRAGAWEFDTARGVDALLVGLAAASEGTGDPPSRSPGERLRRD